MKSFTRIVAFGKTKTEVPVGIKTKEGLLFDNDGWILPTQFLSQNARIVYVSTSEGNDAAASTNQYGRGYYLPTDPVIGDDPTQPTGQIFAYTSLTLAYTAARCIPTGVSSRVPDWILFKRGDTFDLSTLVSGTYQGGRFLSEGTGGGPNTNERRVFGAYGNLAADRPKIANMTTLSSIWGVASKKEIKESNYYFFSLEFPDDSPYGTGFVQILYGPDNVLIEDVKMEGGGIGTNQNVPYDKKSTYILRRCVISNAYRLPAIRDDGRVQDPHVQGLFIGSGDKNWISENIFDMCGYKENPRKPSTWTGGVTSNLVRGELPAGDFSTVTNGVQPTRTYFDRNCYLSSYKDLNLEGNIISRGGGGGCVQMRVGGTARNNAFLWNQHALSVGSNEGSRTYFQNNVVEDNLVLHDDHMLPPGGYAAGLTVSVGDEQAAIVRSNLILHFHGRRSNGGLGMLSGTGILESPGGAPAESSKIIYFDDNVAISNSNSMVSLVAVTETRPGVQEAKVGRNAFLKLREGATFTGVSASDSQFEIGTVNTGGNSYYGNWAQFNSEWQSSGKDTASTLFETLESLGVALGWEANAWEKDIVSYMQYVDPTYVPDENVTVDFAAPAEYRRANAPAVWYVLQNSQLYGGGTGVNLSEADAKLTARRYHATVTFLERAKANRKGSWDEDYTANSINNYFRNQFNKPLVAKSV